MQRNRRGRPRHPDVLTPAEWRVLDALREGGTNAEIASRLGLSPDTVKTHISNMLAKLELRDRRALAAWRPEGERRRLGGVLAVPAALWSVGRPLMWVGAGVATLAGVVVVVVALVALEGIVEGDAGSPAAVKPPPTTSTPAAAPAAPGSCATPTDPTCIRAVYIGAPGRLRAGRRHPVRDAAERRAGRHLPGRRGARGHGRHGGAAAGRLDALLPRPVTARRPTRLGLAAHQAHWHDVHVQGERGRRRTDAHHLRAEGCEAVRAAPARRQAGHRRHGGRDRVRGEGLLVRGSR